MQQYSDITRSMISPKKKGKNELFKEKNKYK